VVAALEMVVGVAEAGLPPAHVGLHAGPVIVSQAVLDTSAGAEVAFREIAP